MALSRPGAANWAWGQSPTAPTPPAPGSTIVYTAIGASDANGVGSSAHVRAVYRLPERDGLRARGSSAAQDAGVYGQPPESGHSDGRHRPGLSDARPAVQPCSSPGTSSSRRCRSSDDRDGGHDFAGVNEVNVDHRRARRRRRRQRSERLHRRPGAGVRHRLRDARDRHQGARAGSPRIVALNVPNAAGLPYLARASLAQRQAAQRIAVGMTRTRSTRSPRRTSSSST